MAEYDLVIIGAGPAGDYAAALAVEEGLEVALIEREKVGGECAYWGCMPSKALLRPGEVLEEDRRVAGVPGGQLDVEAVLARRDEVIDHLDDTRHAERQISRGIHVLRGTGRIRGEKTVELTRADGSQETITARRAVVISVGSGAAVPPIDGLADVMAWTNREITTTSEAPGRLLILGGSAIGVEMAQAWHSLGSSVTIVETLDRLLGKVEPFASELVAGSLRDQGVQLRLGVSAVGASRDADGAIRLTLDDGEELIGDELLVAVGRTPHTDDLGLESVDLAPGELIGVDDRMRVPGHGDWLYAVGDVNGRALLTHAGKYQASVAVANIMNRDARARWDGPLSPQVVFAEPHVASVGYTLEAALEAGISARAVDADPGESPGASFIGHGGVSGARIVVDSDREVMIGATFVGPEMAEWIQGASFAVVGEVPLRTLAHAIPAYPTRSDVWLELLKEWRP